MTAFGVVRGIEAAARVVLGRRELEGLRVTVLGVGRVGLHLCRELHQRGARLFVCDLVPERVRQAVDAFGAVALDEAALYAQEADVFAPCALGGVLNDATVPLLRVRVVAGAANNQLLEPRHGEALARRGITYVPDYALNAGGLIHVAQALAGYDRARVYGRAAHIADTVEMLLGRAQQTGERPEEVADRMAEERLSC